MEIISQLILFLVLLFVLTPAVYASLTVAPFIPTKTDDIGRIAKLAKFKKGDRFLELGAGSGRVMLALAKQYPEITVSGIEIHPLLYLLIKAKILVQGLSLRADIGLGTLYRRDFSASDVIYCFLMPYPMKKLKQKFENECKKGTRIISRAFPVPGWQPAEVSSEDKEMAIYLYKIS
ncbi:MAG: hypothetical protein UV73_C0002G0018 [Candidatus Gottesmanbacteria bacterium GW2011_GWA2_43_14]|uniref:tRNA (guanine(46)-N(7))-methyltransferase n=1 Tax=Candidatus Gottesmanbacteria bacterium GW2011_GWA2_43_14 TaxID=1618443 RepID=A0A0G1DKX6_9BACT|nr:MAG: hypothetical protein UV73_C0002G0018 [Candidatus Gottesmanbacteria bacterium GW2011_GWA2_43_14]